MARVLGCSVDGAVGILVRFWCWADEITVDGRVDGVVDADIDAVVAKDGFCSALRQVGWVEILADGGGIYIPKFDRHNGESSKKRALKNERQARWRAKNVDSGASTDATQKRLPEKRRSKDLKEDAIASPDPIWDDGVELLTSGGLEPDKARKVIGQWVRDWNDVDVRDAIAAGQNAKGDVVAYIRAILREKPRKVRPDKRQQEVLAKVRERYPDARLMGDGTIWESGYGMRWDANTGERRVVI